MSDTSAAPSDGAGQDGTEKQGGLGKGSTIPGGSTGVGAGAGAPSHFEPEEDPEAAAKSADDDADDDLNEGSGHA